MKTLTIIGLIPLKHTVELIDENKNVVYWKLGTALKITDYKIGDNFLVKSTVIEKISR